MTTLIEAWAFSKHEQRWKIDPMPASSQDRIQILLARILELMLSTQERLAQIERGNQLPKTPLRGCALRELDNVSAIALAFRHATAMIAAADTSTAPSQRLAQIFRSGGTDALAAEPELAGATEVVELARDYFVTTKNANSVAAVNILSALRNLLAEEISQGVRPALKPAFKQEYDDFKREYLARSQAVGFSTSC